jgi:hypothetical protein
MVNSFAIFSLAYQFHISMMNYFALTFITVAHYMYSGFALGLFIFLRQGLHLPFVLAINLISLFRFLMKKSH